MPTMSEDAVDLWRKIQDEQAATEAIVPDDAEPAAAAGTGEQSGTTQQEYIDALVRIAADLTAENETLRRIAATAIEQAREVTRLRELFGLSEPDEIKGAVDELRLEVAELRDRVDAPRRRWWRFGR